MYVPNKVFEKVIKRAVVGIFRKILKEPDHLMVAMYKWVSEMSLHLVQLVKATEIYEVILFNSQIQSHLSRCINIELVYNDTLKVSGHWPPLSGTNAK